MVKLMAALSISLVMLSTSTSAAADRGHSRPERSRSEDFDSTVASSWFELLYDVVKQEGTAPPPASRILGIASVALYEAVAPGSSGNRSLAGQLNDLPRISAGIRPHAKHHWGLVANEALAGVIRGLYPTRSDASTAMIDTLHRELKNRYSKEAPKAVLIRSLLLGRLTAHAILRWASSDGAAEACSFIPPVGDGLWEPTPPGFMAPAFPCWGEVRTMALESGGECAPPPHPEYSTDVTSEFYSNAFEVYATRLNLTPAEETIARYWADGPGVTGTPPGHSVSIASGFVLSDDLNLMQAAELYARVGIAVHDAFIGCWHAKYDFNLLRPITYIQDVIDPLWTPLLTTPNFPEYTSGHSTQSGASSVVATDFLGVRSFTDTTRSRHGLQPVIEDRTFSSIEEAAQEAAVSRLYGGIHYPFGNRQGLAQGRCIGETILDRIDFRR